jgi:small conductance mechanosensitive channel
MQEFLNWLLGVARSFGLKLVAAIAVFIIGRIIIKIFVKRLRNGKMSQKMEATVAHFLCNFVNIILYTVLLVSVVAILGVETASVVALLASAGVAVGLALQGSLSNLAGGIMILIFHPFRVGNFIEAGGFSGTVIDIDIFYTVINTPDNKVVTVPNGTVMGGAITNYSVNDTRRVDLVFSVAYGTDAQKVIDVILDEAGKHEMVLKDPEAFCRLTKQNSSSLDFTLRVWVEKDNYWKVNFDLLEAVNARFIAEKIEIPFNQLDVHVKNS